jgi:hypothetical protein
VTRKTLGTLLLIFGVAAWGAYYGLRALTPLEPPFGMFLTWHLLGVIPGAILRGSKLLKLIQRGGKGSANAEEPSA